jgi:hypothetical protein
VDRKCEVSSARLWMLISAISNGTVRSEQISRTPEEESPVSRLAKCRGAALLAAIGPGRPPPSRQSRRVRASASRLAALTGRQRLGARLAVQLWGMGVSPFVWTRWVGNPVRPKKEDNPRRGTRRGSAVNDRVATATRRQGVIEGVLEPPPSGISSPPIAEKIFGPPLMSGSLRTAVDSRRRTRRLSALRIDVAHRTDNSGPVEFCASRSIYEVQPTRERRRRTVAVYSIHSKSGRAENDSPPVRLAKRAR